MLPKNVRNAIDAFEFDSDAILDVVNQSENLIDLPYEAFCKIVRKKPVFPTRIETQELNKIHKFLGTTDHGKTILNYRKQNAL